MSTGLCVALCRDNKRQASHSTTFFGAASRLEVRTDLRNAKTQLNAITRLKLLLLLYSSKNIADQCKPLYRWNVD